MFQNISANGGRTDACGGRATLVVAAVLASMLGVATAEAAITCVPYARKESGLKLYGDGWTWWHQAAGKYARGQRPRAGAVLVFDQVGAMRHGHVAVVKQVVNGRQIIVDHANWGGPGVRKGQIHKGVAVIDTSAGNDWSSVRVWFAPARDFGTRDYPTFGFVHNGTATADDTPLKGKKAGRGKAETVKIKAPMPGHKPSGHKPPGHKPPGHKPVAPTTTAELPVQIAERPDTP